MIQVIGLGLGPHHHLPQELVSEIEHAHLLVGGARQLILFPHAKGKKQELLTPSLSEVIDMLEQEDRLGNRVVVLADGDPLTFGIGTTLVQRLGSSRVRIHPGLSTPQAAAARLGKSMKDVHLVSLHGRNHWPALFASLTHHPVTGVFTDAAHSPDRIAHACLDRGLTSCRFHVFEHLEGPEEQVHTLTLEQASIRSFASLSFVIIEQPDFCHPCLGHEDAAFVHERGLITKFPVRAAGLASLHLCEDHILWDLGAGCGSVGIEGAALLRAGQVVAVEAKAHRVAMIQQNIQRFRAWLVEPIHGSMPDILETLPEPDRIFIGGGAREPEVLATAMNRLKPGGRLVIHIILLETLEAVRTALAQANWPCTIMQTGGSVSDPVAGATRLKPFNPVFIIQAHKPMECK